MGTCAATNKDGTPCGNDVMEGSRYCHVHQESGGEARSGDEYGFWTMLAGAFIVIFVTYFLLRVALGA
jgi:hypothetical protein